jgi:hypothetical protein
MPVTRLGPDGYGVRRAGSFAGKASSSLHPVGRITRFSMDGYGARRAGSFAGKTATAPDAATRHNNPMVASVGRLMCR